MSEPEQCKTWLGSEIRCGFDLGHEGPHAAEADVILVQCADTIEYLTKVIHHECRVAAGVADDDAERSAIFYLATNLAKATMLAQKARKFAQ